MSAGFEEILSRANPEMAELARGARALICEVYPAVVEVPWVKQGTIGYGVGPRKMSEQFCYLAPQAKHVHLGFYYGSELPDRNLIISQRPAGTFSTSFKHVLDHRPHHTQRAQH